MRRRTLLATTGGALAAAAGCLDGITGDGSADGTDATDDPTTTPTDDDPTEPPSAVEDYAAFDPPADAAHRLYVENLDDETHVVDVRVSDGAGAVVLAGRFEARDTGGMEFPEVAPRESTYEVAVALVDRGPAETFQWDARSCDGSEAPEGSRNGSVRIAEGASDLSFAVDGCDAIVAGGAVPTGPATAFSVEGYADPRRTGAPPTRGCPPLLSVSPVDDPAGETVVAFEDLPPDRQAEFEAALAADGDVELDADAEYDFWVDEVRYVRYAGEVYGVAVAVC